MTHKEIEERIVSGESAIVEAARSIAVAFGPLLQQTAEAIRKSVEYLYQLYIHYIDYQVTTA